MRLLSVGENMQRREFIKLIGGAAAGWPLVAHAQQGERMRHIGVLMNTASDDPLGQARVAAFQQALQQLGWSDGRNVRIDIRWGRNDVKQDRKYAAELVALTPDVILAVGTLSVAALQRESRTIPIVFDSVSDPVGAGFVDSLAHPGGNTTGFMIYEYGLSGKWLEFLKQMAPWIKRAGVLRCKFACNSDPLRGDFRVQFRPLLTSCVSVLPFGPDGPGRTLGDDWRGQDRPDTTRLF